MSEHSAEIDALRAAALRVPLRFDWTTARVMEWLRAESDRREQPRTTQPRTTPQDPEPMPADGPEYHAEHAAWRERQTRRADPYARPCPRCGAHPDEPCWNLRTRDANAWPHRERVTPPDVGT